MAKVKLEERYVSFVQVTVDTLVAETGYPVIGKTMTTSGLATKEQLKALVRRGALKCVQVSAGRGHMNAYYTEGVIPHVIREEESKHSEQGESSEVIQGTRAQER
jgi:hypothetical protein